MGVTTQNHPRQTQQKGPITSDDYEYYVVLNTLNKSSNYFIKIKNNIGFTDYANFLQVIVAGGTMEPIDEFRDLLAAGQPLDHRINVLRCGHVVPPENVLALCLSRGPSNLPLNFSYETRNSIELVRFFTDRQTVITYHIYAYPQALN